MSIRLDRAAIAGLLRDARALDGAWLLAEAASALARGVWQPALLDRALDGLRADGHEKFRREDSGLIWARFGAELARAGLLEDAQVALDLALRLRSDDADGRMVAGTVAFQMARLAEAEAHYAEALRLRPGDAGALAARAAVAARDGRMSDARQWADAALLSDGDAHAAHMALARADLGDGALSAAEARLSACLSASADAAVRIALFDLRGEVRERAGDFDGAFGDYAARNALLRVAHAPQYMASGVERRIDQARRIAHWLEAQTRWSRPADVDHRSAERVQAHVFLVGFPRSGTTLLEKALAGHSRCVTLEEEPHLESVAAALVTRAALAGLPHLSAAAVDAARARYWAAVAPALSGRSERPVLVDKMPLNSLLLPVIARLFPDARILLALRDPRDVVLSCFRRRFRMNAAMFEFLELADAAAMYDAVMRVTEAARAVLPLPLVCVRHEALVADFDAVIGEVLAYAGLDWEEAVRDVAARAAARAVTPSDLQLRGGLTSEGIGAWRRFETGLAPVLPDLARWVTWFGYGEGPN